jgi:hypothetical protein
MAFHYLFPAWAERTIGSSRPGDVRAWFLDAGLDIPRQTWRKFLASEPPPSVVWSTWIEICEAAGEPFSAFFEYTHTGRRPKPRLQGRKARPRKRKATPKPTRPALPPRPLDFFGGRHGG